MKTQIEINKSKEGETLVYSFTWELDETNSDHVFVPIQKELKDFKTRVIFDFKALRYLNSKTIGYLVDIFSNIEDAGWEMFIRNCTWGIRDTLNFTWIDTIIPYIDDVKDNQEDENS